MERSRSTTRNNRSSPDATTCRATTSPGRAGLAVGVVVLCAVSLGCQYVSQYQPNPLSTLRGRQYYDQGLAAAEKGEWDEAEESLAKAVRLCDDDLKTRREYARVLSRQGKIEAAIAELEEAVRLDEETDASLFVAIAEKRLLLRQPEAAFAAAQRAIEIDPKSPEAWRVRADVLRRRNQPEAALADYHRALSLSPQNCDLPVRIAETYLTLRKPDRALVALQRLGNRWPGFEEPQRILQLKGVAHSGLGRYSDAVDCFAAAVSRETPTAELYFQLAEAELRAGRPALAARAIRDALQIDPSHQPSRHLADRIGLRSSVPGPAMH